MSSKKVNRHQSSYAFSFIQSNPLKAKHMYEEYLRSYPEDCFASVDYASLLITLGLFDEALEVLDHVDVLLIQNPRFKGEYLMNNILLDRLRILSYLERFEELYELCVLNYDKVKTMDHIDFYAKCKTGRLDPSQKDYCSYLFNQMVQYDENAFFEHMKKHLKDYACLDEVPSESVFASDFPFHKVYEEIKKYIISDQRMFYGFFDDTYLFQYRNCGTYQKKMVDYFKVICFHNTTDVFTMYPIEKEKDLSYVDLNYLSEELDTGNSKIKRISQVDKFNQKYRRK